MATDLDLVNQVRIGNLQAFARLVERYERSVLAVVQAEVRDPEMAQDVAERSLLLAFRRLGNLSDGSQFGPWLLRMARRLSIEAVRSMPVAAGMISGAEGSGDDIDWGNPEWIEHEHLLGLVARLPEDERRIVGLRYFDNHSLAQIADLVGQPIDQVARQFSRAVMRLDFWWKREQGL